MVQKNKRNNTMANGYNPDLPKLRKLQKKQKIINNAETNIKSIHSYFTMGNELWTEKIAEIAEMEADGSFSAEVIEEQKLAMDELALLIGKPKPYNP